MAGTGWITATLNSFASCTEPVALFATGMWAVHKRPLAVGLPRAVVYMVIKLVLVPLLMVRWRGLLANVLLPLPLVVVVVVVAVVVNVRLVVMAPAA